MTEITLAERISRDFSRIKIRKAIVKVPKLRFKKEKNRKTKKNDIPISSVINILIRAAVENTKKERKEKKPAEEGKNYRILKENSGLIVNGGYGTAAKSYGISPHASYVNYEELFSYLGKFKSQSAYENMSDSHAARSNKALQDDGFSLIDAEALEKGAWSVKYFFHPGRFDMYSSLTSLVSPITSMNSAEWEKFKLLMVIDKVAYSLKISTS